eukprot:TRINITY_DN744_c0_g4_i1.p2 TRINITY_DN744_c0_g4~~TRINITY_DN744_c0_g4_i1.p2  ORF type:complete len:230 (-),score=91.31 TRINITY_DN744_c0_g4_i1:132-821(-)
MFKFVNISFVLFILLSVFVHSSICCIRNSDCENNEWCLFPQGLCGGTGTCEEIGIFDCTAEYLPVCGCDGNNYGNACSALSNQMSIDYDGVCDDDGDDNIEDDNNNEDDDLDCDDDSDCDSDSFCRYDEGECGGRGTCADVPIFCYDIFTPTCACDGNIYSNACDVFANRQSIAPESFCNDGCDDDCFESTDDNDSIGSRIGSSSSDSSILNFNIIAGIIALVSLYLLI